MLPPLPKLGLIKNDNAASTPSTALPPLPKLDLGHAVNLVMDNEPYSITHVQEAIAAKESRGSGDYSALGKKNKDGSRGVGKYQVLDRLVGPWTKELLGYSLTPEQYKNNPTIQDKVFNMQFKKLYDRFDGDIDKAIGAWLAGPSGQKNRNAKDVLGTTVQGYIDFVKNHMRSNVANVSTAFENANSTPDITQGNGGFMGTGHSLGEQIGALGHYALEGAKGLGAMIENTKRSLNNEPLSYKKEDFQQGNNPQLFGDSPVSRDLAALGADTPENRRSLGQSPYTIDPTGMIGELGNVQTLIEGLAPKIAKLTSEEKIGNLLSKIGIVGEKARTIASDLAKINESAKVSTYLKSAITPIEESISKLVGAVKSAEPIRGQAEALYTAERARRAALGERAIESTKGAESYRAALGTMKGALPRPTFAPLVGEGKLSEQDVTNLFEHVKSQVPNYFDKLNAFGALSKLIDASGGTVPTESELKILKNLFGNELVDSLLQKRSLGQKIWEGATDILNIPRTLMSSLDMSAAFNQGAPLLTYKPTSWGKAFLEQVKYFFSPKALENATKEIEGRKTFQIMRDSGLYLADITGKSIGLTTKEERFLSNFAGKKGFVANTIRTGVGAGIGALKPAESGKERARNAGVGAGLGFVSGFGVRASERAYAGFLNKLRADVFDSMARNLMENGVTYESKPQEFKALAKFINTMSGRGDLGTLNSASRVLNGMFFSARYAKARLDPLVNPAYYASLTPTARKQSIRALLQYAGGVLTVLGIAKLSGAEVETNPISADFAKIKIGNTRFNPLGGYQGWIRLAAQEIMGETKSSTTGRVTDLTSGKYGAPTRASVLGNFFKNKLAPVPSLGLSLLGDGKSAGGQKLNLDDSYLQFVVQDIRDAVQEGNWSSPLVRGAAVGIPSFFGIQTQTYSPQRGGRGGFKPSFGGRLGPKFQLGPSL